MTRDLLHAPEGSTGIVTSGGSESIMLGVKAARDRARVEKGITEPEMVVPLSAHPAFNKASEYFRIKITRSALTPDFRADVAAMKDAITDNTVLLAGADQLSVLRADGTWETPVRLPGRYLSTEVTCGFTGRVLAVEAVDGDVVLRSFAYAAADD